MVFRNAATRFASPVTSTQGVENALMSNFDLRLERRHSTHSHSFRACMHPVIAGGSSCSNPIDKSEGNFSIPRGIQSNNRNLSPRSEVLRRCETRGGYTTMTKIPVTTRIGVKRIVIEVNRDLTIEQLGMLDDTLQRLGLIKATRVTLHDQLPHKPRQQRPPQPKRSAVENGPQNIPPETKTVHNAGS